LSKSAEKLRIVQGMIQEVIAGRKVKSLHITWCDLDLVSEIVACPEVHMEFFESSEPLGVPTADPQNGVSASCKNE
jgi:hypothetical protein